MHLGYVGPGDMLQVRGTEDHPEFSLGIYEGKGDLDVVGINQEPLVLDFFCSRLRALD